MSKASKALTPVLSAFERAKQLIEAEKAPTVMTRSGITDLANRVRQSEGQFGAQRVERAADEIPNLEKLYQDQALMRAFTGDNAQAVMTMKPSDFERYAAPLGSGLSDRSLQNIIHLTDVQNRGGFSDVPYLNINKKEQGTMGLPYISGHEGRHRNRAIDAAGEQAGLVQLVPRSELREPFPRRSKEEYLEALYKEMQLTGNRVKPEAYYLDPRDDKTYQRKAIELPDFYAQGGMVDSAPEEAIKNTITDPQAFRMLDMDLANLALMNQQPQRMAGGGAVNMDEGGLLQRTVRAFVPSQVRTFVGTLAGDESPITEKNFSGDELDQMRKAIMSSRQDRTAMNARLHHEAMQNAPTAKERRELFNRGPSKELDQTVGYQHYQGSPTDLISDFSLSSDSAIRNTLGRFSYEKTPEGNLVAKDLYKFRDDQSDKTRPTSDYADMGTAAKLWALTKDTFGDAGLQTLPSRTGNAFLGNKPGRPVNVNLGKAPFAQGGVVHMAGGGMKKFVRPAADAIMDLDKAKKAAEKAAKANPAPLPRAPIKTDEEIMAIAQRMAPQVRGDFVRNPSGTQGVMGLSRKQWEREQGLVHDIRDTRPLEEPPVVDYKDFRGEVKVGIKGDPTLTDKTIYAVDNNVLREPSPQEGGSMYGVNSPAAWASGPIPATTVSNLSRNASRQYGNVPSFAEYVKMGPDSHAYAVHVSDALLQAMHPERMTKKQLNGFNQLIKNGDPNYGRFPNWAGIENPEEAFLQLAAHPDLRQVFYNTATMPTITNALGMPNGLDVVHATLDPKLRNLETGATGRALVRIDPNVSSLPLSRHTTYERDIPGHSFGQTKFPMPYELSFPDTLKSIKENPVQAPREFGSFGMVGPRQIIDDQFIDEINRYNQMMDDLLKKKKGGAVHMAEGGQVQHFDEGGEVSQSELDRMKFEIAQQQNPTSPVMQATPRSPIQDAIGTFGGYMDKAGKFVSEAIAPTAEKHPVKHFIADLLLAESLKSAGTALQDYTGTARETDEDNPVRGVISKNFRHLNTSTEPLLDPRALDLAGFATPVVKGVTKLANVGAKAITPFATRVDDMVRELSASGALPQPGLSIKDVTPKALAPANEQGFYSPTEAAALNLQRKTGNGQAFLNDIMKGENVKAEEISAMGLDTFLKDKKNVTAAEVQDYIAQNKLGLGEARYDDKPKPNFMEFLHQKGIPQDDVYRILDKAENGIFDKQVAPLRDEWLNSENKSTKFGQYQLPGGENYREVVLTLPIENQDALNAAQIKAGDLRRQTGDLMQKYKDISVMSNPGDPDLVAAYQKVAESRKLMNEAEAEADKLRRVASEKTYRSSHFDEPNPIAHLRMSDRVTDGKKTLLVDEVQSDWHQAARDARTLEVKRLMNTYNVSKEDAQKAVPNDYGYKLPPEVTAPMDSEYRALVHKNADAVAQGLTPDPNDVARARMLESQLMQSDSSKIPNAPYKEDWYQLALRRAIKEAIDGGYDRVALPTGQRVAERFDLSKQVDRIVVAKLKDGTFAWNAQKDGRIIQDQVAKNANDLSLAVGKDLARKAEAQTDIGANSIYEGDDLRVGGEGMKKYYDEIYPSYLKKFGKKYGASVGKTDVVTDNKANGILEDNGKFLVDSGDGINFKEFNTYAEAAKHLGVGVEPLHYMDITPAMRKEFSTGIHMKKGGKVSFASNIDAMRHELNKRQ
jgi:hypothetical protein